MKNFKTKRGIITITIAVLFIIGLMAFGINQYKHSGKTPQQAQTQGETKDAQKDAAKDNKSETKSTDQKQTADSKSGEKKTENASSAPENKRPAFLYFVSESDANYNDALKVFDELKKQYGDKVDFELKNITKDPKILENFKLVEGKTPFLIMDGKNDMGMVPQSVDKSKLEAEITKMLK